MPEDDRITRANDFLAEEMAAAHAAFQRITSNAEGLTETGSTYCDRWEVAIRLMSAQIAAANALKRLSNQRDAFTFTYVHQGTPPEIENDCTFASRSQYLQ